MNRGEIFWANLDPPAGRHPVVVLTRNPAIPVLTSVVVAQVTSNARGIASEVSLDRKNGVRTGSVVNCDMIFKVPKQSLDPEPIGSLDLEDRVRLDHALRYALAIVY